MLSVSGPRIRPERLIAAGRVVLAVFSLFAVWLDPTEPAKFAGVTYGLLVAYVLYAIAVVGLVWRARTISATFPIATHVLDLALFSLFIFLTAGPGSPFGVYFVFALMCGMLRWQLRGTVWTAVCILSVFVAFGVFLGVVAQDPRFDVRAFAIRGVYLFVLGVLLGYISIHEKRSRHEMWLLASWPHTRDPDLESLTSQLLGYAEPLLDAPVAALAWTGDDGPGLRLACWQRGRWSLSRHPASLALVHPDLEDRGFICADLATGRTLVQPDPKSLDLELWTGQCLSFDLGLLVPPRTALSVPVAGEYVKGRLFLIDKADLARDDLMTAEIMASVSASRLDSFYLNQQLQQSAATEERIRLSRDLHDGVLQSFTGTALKLAAIRGMIERDQPGVSLELERLQRLITAEQRELRFFIQDLRPAASRSKPFDLTERLSELAARVEREWELRVDLRVDVPPGLSDAFCRDIYHIVREALVNAARHGAAATGTVKVIADGQHGVTLRIADDGRGFPCAGSYTTDEMKALGLGPKAIRERVQSLRGSLTLETGPGGTALHIHLPSVAA
jgi:signal transduction histidine kinase